MIATVAMTPALVRKIVENMESSIACYGLLKHEFAASRLCVRQIFPCGSYSSSRCFIVKPTRYMSKIPLRDVRTQFLRSSFSTGASVNPDQAVLDEEEAGSFSKSSKLVGDDAIAEAEARSEDEARLCSSSLEQTQIKVSSQEELVEEKKEILVSGSSTGESTAVASVPKMTIIVFDLETTGFRAAGDRIIEFAARDLAGGDCSTLSALVNPGQTVPYFITAVTGITNKMVNQPHIPSWKEVGTAIIRFTESRRKGGEPVILVAHNARRFDVPFLLKEFQSCSIQVPDWWLFLDTMPLARETKKRHGYNWRSLKLSDIHQAYGLESTGRAHRAMADVNMLASVLEVIVSELELPASDFLDKAFTAEEVYASSKVFQDKDAEDLVTELAAPQEMIEDSVPWELETAIDEGEEQMVLEADMEGMSEETMTGFSSTFSDTSSVDATLLTPVLARYVEAKRKRPTFVHLVRAGNFYEAYFEDAVTLSRACKVRQSTVEIAKMEIPVTRFPACRLYMYTRALLDRGLGIVKIGDEMQELASVWTPGMLLDEVVIDETRNNYLAAVNMSSDGSWGLAFCDIATGDFCATRSEGLPALLEELGRLKPREAVFNSEAIRAVKNTELCSITRESSEFSPVTKDNLLLPYIGESTVDVVEQWPLADCAARALLRYIQQIQELSLEQLSLRQIFLYRTQDYLRMDESVRNYLEMVESAKARTGSVLWVMDDTRTLMGARLLREWMLRPLKNFDQILSRQNAVEILVNNSPVREGIRSCLSNMVDIASLSASVARQSTILWDALVALEESLLVVSRLSEILQKLPENLYFSSIIQHQAFVEKLADEMQVARRSDDDAELVLEPSETLVESTRKKVLHSLPVLQEISSALSALDVLCSFAEIAVTRDFCKPELLAEGRQITILDGRHPVVEVHEDFQPTSCFLGHQPKRGRSKKAEDRADLLVVTGTKGTGKTRYLQQVALIQVLAQIGSFVPAKDARLSIADGVYCVDWPDTDGVLEKVSSNSLVLLDDFHLRTGFQETEAALLRAVMEYLANHVNARALLAMEGYYENYHTEFSNIAACHFSASHAQLSGLAPPPDGFPSGDYPEWIRKRASKLLEKNARSKCRDEAGSDAAEGVTLWHKLMSLTTAKTKSSSVSKTENGATDSTREDLEQLWQKVSTVLQNSPATLALATQKGSLLSITRTSQPAIVTIGSSPLFVRKFQQDEHAAALEAAFESLLNRPVKLQILVED